MKIMTFDPSNTVFIHGFIGGIVGFLILHPVSMIIQNYYAPQHLQTLELLVQLASLQHLPMVIYFMTVGIVFGVFYGFYARRTASEISERERTEKALIQSEERFRSLAQSANDAIVSVDGEGKIVFWNGAAQEMFGYMEEEVLSKELTFLIPERYREAHREGMKRFLSSGESHVTGNTLELHGLRKRGDDFPLELSVASWKSGNETFFTGIIRDINERKKAEEQLEKLVADLQTALSEVKVLGGLLPICSSCNKIRDDKGYWNQLESYITRHSDAEFSHSICPDCARELYPRFYKKRAA